VRGALNIAKSSISPSKKEVTEASKSLPIFVSMVQVAGSRSGTHITNGHGFKLGHGDGFDVPCSSPSTYTLDTDPSQVPTTWCQAPSA
jgi:hypothetical protein